RCRTRRSRGLQQSRLRQGRTGAPPVSVLSCHSPYEGHQVSPKRIPGGAELQDGRDVVVTLLVKHSWPGPSGGPPRFDQPCGLLLKARRVQLRDREQTGNVRSCQRLECRGFGETPAIAPEVRLLELSVLQDRQIVHAGEHDRPRQRRYGAATMLPDNIPGDVHRPCRLPYQYQPARIPAEAADVGGEPRQRQGEVFRSRRPTRSRSQAVGERHTEQTVFYRPYPYVAVERRARR